MKETKCPLGYSMEYIKENFGLTNAFSKCSGCELFSYTGDECYCNLLILNDVKTVVASFTETHTFDFSNSSHAVIGMDVPDENIEGE